MHVGKLAQSGGVNPFPPYIPDVNSLPLDLYWSISKVHILLDQLKFYSYFGEVLRYTTK
jgi:hypothetical protein